jgi:hypothetical protein
MKRVIGAVAFLAVIMSACSELPTEPQDAIRHDDATAAAKASLAASMPAGNEAVYGNWLATGPVPMPRFWRSTYGRNLNLYDDDCRYVPLGFTFTFYGRPYMGVWVNSNGNISFSGCYTGYSPATLPRPGVAMAGPIFGDWNPYSGGSVHGHVETVGTRRVFVATWNGVPEYASSTTHSTFQLQLHEAGNILVMSYWTLRTDGIDWLGGPMTAGLSAGSGLPTILATGTQVPSLAGRSFCFMTKDWDIRTLHESVCALFIPR